MNCGFGCFANHGIECKCPKPAITVHAKDSLGLAAPAWQKRELSVLPVLDENSRLVGVLSRVDVLRLVTEKEAKKTDRPLGAAISVRDVMSPSIPVVQEKDDLATIVDPCWRWIRTA